MALDLILILLLCAAYAVLHLRHFEAGIASVQAELAENRKRDDRSAW